MDISERKRLLGTKLHSARVRAKALSSSHGVQTSNRSHGITQAQVARQLGISQSFISKIERGEQEASFLLIEQIAAYYKVPIGRFATYTDADRPASVFELQDRM